MKFKHILLIVFVGICFLLVIATVAMAFDESAQTADQDLDQYHARVNVTKAPTLEPTATLAYQLPTPTPTISGVFDED